MKKLIGDKDTAFRSFLKKVEEAGCWAIFSNNIPHELLDDALEKEMEQIVDAWDNGFQDGQDDMTTTSGENYYVGQYGFVRE